MILSAAVFIASLTVMDARPRLRSCDLIFVSGSRSSEDSSMDKAITLATGDPESMSFTHVAIVERRWMRLWVIDASPRHGVARRRFSEFLKEQEGPGVHLAVKRLRTMRGLSRRDILCNAESYLWQSYDFTFMPDNGMMYCSELVRESYRDRQGRYIFDAAPMNFLAPDGSLPEYWHELFESIETEVPQGVPGTNPQDMSQSPLLETVTTFAL